MASGPPQRTGAVHGRRRPARRVLIAVCALGLALTAGCTSGSAGGSAGAAGDGGGTGPRAEEFDPAAVLAEQTVTLPTSPEDEVTWGVLSLRVQGQTMTLRMAVTPRFGTVAADGVVSLFDCLQRSAFRPVLVDLDNLKEYSVIGSAPSRWSSDAASSRVRNGHPMFVWAVYAAPEDDIDTITLRVADWWPPIVDVPIER